MKCISHNFLWYVIFLFTPFFLQAQLLKPVKWSYTISESKTAETEILFMARIVDGWHLYDMNLPEGGPVSTEFIFKELNGVKLNGNMRAKSPVIKKRDIVFDNMELRWYEKEAVFAQPIIVTDRKIFSINAEVIFMACNDMQCLSPTTFEFSLTPQDVALIPSKSQESVAISDRDSGINTLQVTKKTVAVIDSNLPSIITSERIHSQSFPVSDSILWQPVIQKLQQYGEPDLGEQTSWWFIFIIGLGGGFLALLTPCVWPIIPLTVSFFLKRSGNRKKAVRQSLLYGASIVAIYLTSGLLITAIFGASALNSMSTHAVFNLLFFALLVFFAISFLGAFDIKLPASWTNMMSEKAGNTAGFVSIFFMAFTLTLASFSCTGLIIGSLLVQAASLGAIAGPAIGMLGFALALAVPFTLFAIFPAWLKNLPKSGGWLNSIKVVLGFIELAFALKFFSVADMAYHWRILDRETFLVLWIVLFALLGFYLLGKISFPHDSQIKHVSIPRFFLATVSLAFAIYLIPGLWGAPLRAASAFLPPGNTQDFSLYTKAVHAQFDDYETGMLYARNNNKPVIIDFSGFGCVNCRKMETAVWIDPTIKELLEKEYVLITLFVDDKTSLPRHLTVDDAGTQRTLKTVGDKWGYLQSHKFGYNAQPFYVLLDNEGNPLAKSFGYDENVKAFTAYLQNGLAEYVKRND